MFDDGSASCFIYTLYTAVAVTVCSASATVYALRICTAQEIDHSKLYKY